MCHDVTLQQWHCQSMRAGMSHLLQRPAVPAGLPCFAALEGLSCQTGLLDGPTSLLTSLLACGPSSDAGLAALQAGQHTTLACCAHTTASVLLPDNLYACVVIPVSLTRMRSCAAMTAACPCSTSQWNTSLPKAKQLK